MALTRSSQVHAVTIRGEHRDADEMIVRDVILDDCYKVYDLPSPVLTCIDVGAHIGSFIYALLDRFPNAQVVACEAHPANIPVLTQNIWQWRARAVAMPKAVVANPTEPAWLHSTIFDGTGNTGGSYVEQGEAPTKQFSDEYRGKIGVSCIALDEVASRLLLQGDPVRPHRKIDLVKLDCEGSEEGILSTCNLELYNCFVGEWHNKSNFLKIVKERFPSDAWSFDILRDQTCGLFRLCRRSFSHPTT